MDQRVLLVIPCFNEAKRIKIEKFKEAPSFISFLFVDDGSSDGTFAFLQSRLDQRMQVMKLEKNGGKGEAVRQGILFAKERPDQFAFDWIGYWDADLSTPLYEVENFLRYNNDFYGHQPVVIGSRIFRFGGNIHRYVHRHLRGRFFATVVRRFFRLDSYDSQCGAKLFRKDVVDKCFSEEFISSWIFDVEIILRMRNKDIVEYPLKEWTDVSGGSLNFPKVAFRVLKDIYRMKKRYPGGDR